MNVPRIAAHPHHKRLLACYFTSMIERWADELGMEKCFSFNERLVIVEKLLESMSYKVEILGTVITFLGADNCVVIAIVCDNHEKLLSFKARCEYFQKEFLTKPEQDTFIREAAMPPEFNGIPLCISDIYSWERYALEGNTFTITLELPYFL